MGFSRSQRIPRAGSSVLTASAASVLSRHRHHHTNTRVHTSLPQKYPISSAFRSHRFSLLIGWWLAGKNRFFESQPTGGFKVIRMHRHAQPNAPYLTCHLSWTNDTSLRIYKTCSKKYLDGTNSSRSFVSAANTHTSM